MRPALAARCPGTTTGKLTDSSVNRPAKLRILLYPLRDIAATGFQCLKFEQRA